MNLSKIRRRWQIGVATGVLLLLAAGSSVDAQELVPIPQPNLSYMEEAVQKQLSAVLDELSSLVEATQREPSRSGRELEGQQLAQAYGAVGQVHLAYNLNDTARACFENAHRLAPRTFAWSYYLGLVEALTGNLDAADQAFRSALEIEPGDAPTLLRWADVLLTQGRLAEADQLFQRAASKEPAAAHAGRGRVAFLENDFPAAIAEIERALALEPDASALHYRLALAYREAGDLEQAQSHLDRQGTREVSWADPWVEQLAQTSGGSMIHYMRGTRALRQRDYPQAIAEYRQAVSIAPDNTVVRQALGTALVRSGELEAGIEEYRRALASEPNNVLLHYDLATALLEQGARDEAARHFEQALDIDDEFLDAHWALALQEARQGRFDSARRHLERILEIDPFHVEAHFRLGRVLAGQSRYAEAVSELARAVELDSEHMAARLDLGKLLAAMGQIAPALEHYAHILRAAQDEALRAGAYIARAAIWRRQNSVDRAIDDLRRATALEPEWIEPELRLADLLRSEGSLPDSLALYRADLEKQPDQAAARRGEAAVLIEQGRYDEALRRLQEALRAVPEEPALMGLLARLLATCPDDNLRDGPRAAQLAEASWRSQSTFEHAETLALALATAGRLDDALRLLKQLIESAAKNAPESVPRLRQHLATLEDGRLVLLPSPPSD